MARKTREKKTAGALDVRNIIGTLMATYGVILLAVSYTHLTLPTKA